MKTMSFILLTALLTQKSYGNSEPDLDKEKWFHKIYSKYNASPLSNEKWTQLISKRSEVYTVQSGDTLWAISETFFGDPSVWPKIWSVNSEDILNPHEITPGQQIQFVAGNIEHAPHLELKNSSSTSAEDSGHLEKSVDPSENLETLIPPEKPRSPLLETIPNSLPQYNYTSLSSPSDLTLEFAEQKTSIAKKYLVNFLTEGPVNSQGKVIETEMGVHSAAEHQFIFVEVDESNIDPNRIYTVVKEIYDFANNALPYNFSDLRVNELQGEIKLLEKVNEGKVYRAVVLKNVGLLQVGSVLIPGPMPQFDLAESPVTNIKSGQIIGGQDAGGKRKLLSNEEIVFLNVGSNDGASEGQTVEVFGNMKVRKKETVAIMNDRPIGLIKILRVTPRFSTGIVTKSYEDIVVGDLVGTRASPDVDIKEN